MTEITKQRIALLKAMGFTIQGIAAECNITENTIYNGINGTATSGRTEQKIGECFKKFVGIRATQVNDAMELM